MNKLLYFSGLAGGAILIGYVGTSYWVVVPVAFLWGFFYRRIVNFLTGVVKEINK